MSSTFQKRLPPNIVGNLDCTLFYILPYWVPLRVSIASETWQQSFFDDLSLHCDKFLNNMFYKHTFLGSETFGLFVMIMVLVVTISLDILSFL